MAKFNQDAPQFGSAKPANMGRSQHCAECEQILADVLDGTLSTEDQAKFDQHVAGCANCAEMLADAQRGAAWLEMLRTPRPEPPAALLERILAQTSGQLGGQMSTQTSAHAGLSVPGQMTLVASSSSPAAHSASGDIGVAGLARSPLEDDETAPGTNVIPFRSRFGGRVAAAFRGNPLGQTMLQPRLAMTAAMAFFSIGLTLNLLGVHLNQLHAADLKPSSLRRSFYQANAHMVRYYDNLRVVYELESRVRDLQRSSDNDAAPRPDSSDRQTAPDAKPGKTGQPGTQPDVQPNDRPDQKKPRPNSGTSRRQAPAASASLLASFRADTPVSPPWRSASTPNLSFRIAGTLQEGELV